MLYILFFTIINHNNYLNQLPDTEGQEIMTEKKLIQKIRYIRFKWSIVIHAAFILVFVFISPADSLGSIYYVDFNYSGTETGTSAQPFNTINDAVSIANCGDKIYIKGGVYSISNSNRKAIEVKNFDRNCTCSNNLPEEMLTITVDPNTAGTVILNATGSFGNNSFFRIFNSKCVYFNGDNRLIVDGSAAAFDGNSSLVSIFSYKRVIENIVFENTEVRNSVGRGISFRQELNSPPGNIVIRKNKIHNISMRAVGGFGNTVYIENNEIWDAAMSNRYQAFGGGGWPGVIQMARRYDDVNDYYHYNRNIFISNNTIHDSWGEGIIMGFTLNGRVTQNNIYNVFSVYIYVGTSKDIIINKNHLYRTLNTYDRNDKPQPIPHGISFAAESYSWGRNQEPIITENIRIQNNLIDSVGNGVRHWHDNENQYPTNTYKDIYIIYNILRNLHDTPINIDRVPDGFIRPTNGQIKNNIIENSGTGSSETYIIGDESIWIISNNNWTGGLPLNRDNIASHDQIPGYLGPDLNTGSDPENYRIVSGSENISAGTVTVADNDYWDSIRDDVNPSIGIYEFPTVGVPPSSPKKLKIVMSP